MSRSAVHFQITFYLLALSMIVLPFSIYLMLPIAIALFLNWLIEWNWKEKWNNIKDKQAIPIAIICITFFVLQVVGVAYSTDYQSAISNLECKLWFFVAPLTLFSYSTKRLTINKINQLFFIFILSCLIVVIINFSLSTIQYFRTNNYQYFFYGQLSHLMPSRPMHPSYNAMYMVFAFILSVYYLIFSKSFKTPLFKSILIISLVLLFIYIIFLQSKAGILSLAIAIILLIIHYLYQVRRKQLIVTLLVFVVLIASTLLICYQHLPVNRFKAAIEEIKSNNNNLYDGTTQRIMVWRVAHQCAIDYLPFGAGTGDANKVLFDDYKEKGYNIILYHKLNAHNQYLQTTIALGLPGLISLLLYLCFPLITSIKKRDIVYLCLIIVILMNLLVESMFETRAGVCFTAIFYVLMYLHNQLTNQTTEGDIIPKQQHQNPA